MWPGSGFTRACPHLSLSCPLSCPAASGKTTVCDRIVQRLHDQCVVMLNQDSFYRTLTEVRVCLSVCTCKARQGLPAVQAPCGAEGVEQVAFLGGRVQQAKLVCAPSSSTLQCTKC